MLDLFPSKLKFKWTGPFLLKKLFPHGVVELENIEGIRFKVNMQRIKMYLENAKSLHEVIEAYHLDGVLIIKRPTSCRDVKLSVA